MGPAGWNGHHDVGLSLLWLVLIIGVFCTKPDASYTIMASGVDDWIAATSHDPGKPAVCAPCPTPCHWGLDRKSGLSSSFSIRQSILSLESEQRYTLLATSGHSGFCCQPGLTGFWSCRDDEIKTELNARGYGAVLDMDEDLALDMLFTQLVDQRIQEEKMVGHCSGPRNACLTHEQSASCQESWLHVSTIAVRARTSLMQRLPGGEIGS